MMYINAGICEIHGRFDENFMGSYLIIEEEAIFP
jgi:hypothetical protein